VKDYIHGVTIRKTTSNIFTATKTLSHGTTHTHYTSNYIHRHKINTDSKHCINYSRLLGGTALNLEARTQSISQKAIKLWLKSDGARLAQAV
jgi:hypothetical protein